jgi:hypothetical protein
MKAPMASPAREALMPVYLRVSLNVKSGKWECEIRTYRIPWLLASDKELRTSNIADTVADEDGSPDNGAFGKAADVGRDQAESEGDIGRECTAETQSRHSACAAVQGIDHNHADHRC